jgi:hypothetical protein
MVGATAGLWLSLASGKFAVEVNGVVVGWQPAASWPHLRAWASEHGFLTVVIGSVACVALGRALASAVAHTRASRDHRRNA